MRSWTVRLSIGVVVVGLVATGFLIAISKLNNDHSTITSLESQMRALRNASSAQAASTKRLSREVLTLNGQIDTSTATSSGSAAGTSSTLDGINNQILNLFAQNLAISTKIGSSPVTPNISTLLDNTVGVVNCLVQSQGRNGNCP